MRCLTVPGLNGSGPTHWQTLWEHKYQFERVSQQDWQTPDAKLWMESLDASIRSRPEKAIVIAHSMGCWTLIHWASLRDDSRDLVNAALLVAPPDIETSHALPGSVRDFVPHPIIRLPFPSILAGSVNDPYSSLEKSQALATDLGSRFINAGFAGHINVGSGHGPWPQGEELLEILLRRS